MLRSLVLVPFVVLVACAASTSPVDPELFCIERRSAECVRDRVANRLSQTAYETCVERVRPDCTGATWTDDCQPTQEAASACIAALRSNDLLATESSDIEACQDESLCQ